MTQIPLLIIPNFFLFPYCDNNLDLENNPHWKKIIYQAQKNHSGKLLVIPKPLELKASGQEIITAGTLAEINWGGVETTNLELIINSLKTIQLRGLTRISKIFDLTHEDEIWKAHYQILPEVELEPQRMNELTEKLFQNLVWIIERSKLVSPPFEGSPFAIIRESKISHFIDLITQNGKGISPETKAKILASANLEERLAILLNSFVEQETKERIEKQQANYFKQEKDKVINQKLKRGGSEIENYLQKIEKEPYPDYVKKAVLEEIERLKEASPNDISIIKQYIKWLINLPWWQRTPETNDLELARQKLNQKHYNLQEVKKTIIEYLSIRKRVLTAPQKNKEETLGEVICLEGPPGVGKTSLASTIAEAMGRKYVSISLSGVRDEAEIVGHRTTYIGAMPGRIIQKMKEVGVINPVFLIDEVDKISSDYRNNPAHALLRALDPDFNKKFIDGYLGENVPYNLSEVMFICTANDTRYLHSALRNRMKIIRISPYTELEKVEIAKNYLIPKYLNKYNFSNHEITFQEAAIRSIIRDYTTRRAEGGVRELSRQIDTAFRKFSVKLEENPSFRVEITPSNLHEFLNKEDYTPFHPQVYSRPGVVNGLAYSGYGGDVLQIEVAFYEKKGGGLEVTGNLGEVMKESIKVALTYIKSNHQELGVNPQLFSQHIIHINTLEGAIPKEGPSAGIAITSAIISALTKRVIPVDIGMTGTISLHGQVGEIGAVKEKVIGGYNKGLKRFIIPKANQKDLENIPSKAKIFPVENYQEVLKIIFEEKDKKVVKKRTKNDLASGKKRKRISSSV